MNKIKTRVNIDTNYIFHMLSVSNCGYDNSYGEKYRSFHKEGDLRILNECEKLLTICGGEYIGELYGPLIALPARAERSAYEYYSDMYELFYNADISEELEYKEYRREICDICRVMKENYNTYVKKIWPDSENELKEYSQNIEMIFDENNFTELAERFVGEHYKFGTFFATMCNSVAFGAEAIDISENQDVFGIEHSFEDAFYFIGHEYIIYLLKQALIQTSAFQSFDTWAIIEGLAEFYLILIMGNSRLFNEQQKYAEFYKQLYSINPEYTAKDLYLLALKEFKIGQES